MHSVLVLPRTWRGWILPSIPSSDGCYHRLQSEEGGNSATEQKWFLALTIFPPGPLPADSRVTPSIEVTCSARHRHLYSSSVRLFRVEARLTQAGLRTGRSKLAQSSKSTTPAKGPVTGPPWFLHLRHTHAERKPLSMRGAWCVVAT
jgi:hypothetical protein